MSQDKLEPLAIGAQWVRKSQSDSGGYSVFNFASTLCRYISHPIMLDHSTQLMPGGGGDTAPPLGRCSIIDTKSMSISMASSDDIDGGSDGRGEGHVVLQVL
jgi:hypothetical protein